MIFRNYQSLKKFRKVYEGFLKQSVNSTTIGFKEIENGQFDTLKDLEYKIWLAKAGEQLP